MYTFSVMDIGCCKVTVTQSSIIKRILFNLYKEQIEMLAGPSESSYEKKAVTIKKNKLYLYDLPTLFLNWLKVFTNAGKQTMSN